jgi:hypothetical protein
VHRVSAQAAVGGIANAEEGNDARGNGAVARYPEKGGIDIP